MRATIFYRRYLKAQRAKRAKRAKRDKMNTEMNQTFVYGLFALFVLMLAVVQVLSDKKETLSPFTGDMRTLTRDIPFGAYLVVSVAIILAGLVYGAIKQDTGDLKFTIIPLGYVSLTATALTLIFAFYENLTL
jgi:hypothetical protein